MNIIENAKSPILIVQFAPSTISQPRLILRPIASRHRRHLAASRNAKGPPLGDPG